MKVNIKVPESLNEITLAQYQSFIKESENLKGDELKESMLHHFCFVKREAVKLIKKTSIDDVCLHLDAMFSIEKPLIQKVEFAEGVFGFIPSLDDMTWGEYIDADKYINDWSTMHLAMAVLFRPLIKEKGDQYDIEDYKGTDEYGELMKLMPLSAVLGAMVFFYDLGKELLKAIPRYLMEEMEKETSQKSHSSTEIGDGIVQSINLLEETLQGLTKSLEFDLHKH